MASQMPTSGRDETELETQISDAVACLFLDLFGKGPLSAVTTITGDIVTTVLKDVYTVAEKALIAEGRIESVLSTRVLWQHATDAAFKKAIGQAVGRQVQTVISGFELSDNVATEVFVLAPHT